MKRLFILGCISSILLLSGCHRGGSGELTGVLKRGKYFEPSPLGMVLIPGQSFNIGAGDQDVANSAVPTRTVDLSTFWMDDTEITNNEYRQFVYWVRDSMARQILSEQFEEFKITQDRKGNAIDPPILDWKRKLDWRNPDYKDALEPMFYAGSDRIMGRKELDTRKLNYSYSWVDLQQAARLQNAYNYKEQSYKGGSVNDLNGKNVPIEGRSSFIMSDGVNVYPDTLVWIRDFTYAFNDPLTNKYFSHPGFDDYPVVGVTWKQAKAFCMWRTNFKNSALAGKGDFGVQDYRLPSEAEWELAARYKDGISWTYGTWASGATADYNDATATQLVDWYSLNSSNVTHAVKGKLPNALGLYDMSGNVWEWNFEYRAPDDLEHDWTRLIRGGSWRWGDYMQVGNTNDGATPWFAYYEVGFRFVRTDL